MRPADRELVRVEDQQIAAGVVRLMARAGIGAVAAHVGSRRVDLEVVLRVGGEARSDRQLREDGGRREGSST